jgi:carboxymethylenebutenolidase
MNIRIPVPSGGEMPAYLATPVRPGAGIVVIQEIFGITDSMKAICDFLAARQFVALCPEMYWRTDPGLIVPENESEKARTARGKVNDDTASGDIGAAIEFLRKHPSVNAGVGVAGYCWGGLLAFLAATQQKVDAAVSYYGVGIEKRLDLAKNLSCPMMFHFAELDQFAGPAVAEQVRTAFDGDARVTVYSYKGANHAFARPNGHNYHHPSADLANMRTLSFFVEKLVGKR